MQILQILQLVCSVTGSLLFVWEQWLCFPLWVVLIPIAP
jgi:hypothetical protein